MIKFLKILLGTVFTLLILIGSCVFYAFKIEPYRIASNQLYLNEKTSDFIKVVQFSDTHIKADFNYKNLDKVVNYINKQNPDVVVFTGDLYDNCWTPAIKIPFSVQLHTSIILITARAGYTGSINK